MISMTTWIEQSPTVAWGVLSTWLYLEHIENIIHYQIRAVRTSRTKWCMSIEPCLTRFWYILDKICDWKFDRTCSIRHVVKVRLVSRVYSVKIDHLFEPQTGWFFLLTTLKPKWNKLYFWTDGWFIWKCRVWKFYPNFIPQ